MADLKIHIGEDASDMGRRFVAAWKRLEGGAPVDERHLTFASLQDAAKVLTPKRIALLRALHGRPVPSVRALAESVTRDYKNVHEDVRVLLAAGLIDRDDLGGLRADYDGITVAMEIAL